MATRTTIFSLSFVILGRKGGTSRARTLGGLESIIRPKLVQSIDLTLHKFSPSQIARLAFEFS
jgi:hypothetical protein